MTDRDVHAPVAMPISEKYRDMGTIVVGKIESGRLRKGSNLILMPNKVRLLLGNQSWADAGYATNRTKSK